MGGNASIPTTPDTTLVKREVRVLKAINNVRSPYGFGMIDGDVDLLLDVSEIGYKIHKNKFLNMDEAEVIHDQLADNSQRQYISLTVRRGRDWDDGEIQLLQWLCFNYALRSGKLPHKFV